MTNATPNVPNIMTSQIARNWCGVKGSGDDSIWFLPSDQLADPQVHAVPAHALGAPRPPDAGDLADDELVPHGPPDARVAAVVAVVAQHEHGAFGDDHRLEVTAAATALAGHFVRA